MFMPGDVPSCSLKPEERDALITQFGHREEVEDDHEYDSDELDAIERRMVNADDPSPAHRRAVRGYEDEPKGSFWTPPKPPVPVSICGSSSAPDVV